LEDLLQRNSWMKELLLCWKNCRNAMLVINWDLVIVESSVLLSNVVCRMLWPRAGQWPLLAWFR
jgi:hypothetical protein